MSDLVQISDPHFGTERPEVVEALLRFVRERSPELVVMSGDITQRATRAQFAAARAFVDRLAPPALLAIAGNHDVPLVNLFARVFAPYANHRRVFGADLEPEHRSPSWLVLGVKTTRRWRHSNGEVSAAQIERVAERLEAAEAGQIRVVVVHQPVAVPDAADRDNLLRGRQAAIRRWAAAGADVILGGHIHLPYVVALHERHALARRLWCVQAGTALSSRVRDGVDNSINVLVVDRSAGDGARKATIERWDFDAGTGRFQLAGTSSLALGTAAAAP